MRFSVILAQAAFAVICSALPENPAGLANGFYLTKNYLNGTIVTVELKDGLRSESVKSTGTRSIGPKRAVPRGLGNGLNKRYTVCWGDALSHYGVDYITDWWRRTIEYDTEGPFLLSSNAYTAYYHLERDGAIVYYCINAPWSSGSLDLNDINYALGRMDNQCASYTSSYFQWDGSVEIFGKALSSTPVCQG